MTPAIITTLLILLISGYLFITEKLSVDLVGLMVLIALPLFGVITPTQALSGFSSSAVVTVWTMFILSAGLARTGVAGWIGRQVIHFGGNSKTRVLLILMISAASLSSIMTNIGVVALFLPIVMEISRKTKIASSYLLMPLVFSALIGGMTTLIGTPTNILVNSSLLQFNFEELGMFDFTSIGLVITVGGILFLLVFSNKLLPKDSAPSSKHFEKENVTESFNIQNRFFAIRVPVRSQLVGTSLKYSRLGAGLGINVVGIIRNQKSILAPPASMVIEAEDLLLVTGRADKLKELGYQRPFEIKHRSLSWRNLVSDKIRLVELRLTNDSSLIGKSLSNINFRQEYKGIVIAFKRSGNPIRTNLEFKTFEEGDVLLVQTSLLQIPHLQNSNQFEVLEKEEIEGYMLEERLLIINLPFTSSLCGKTLIDSHLGDSYGLSVLGIVREDGFELMPNPDCVLKPHDDLLVKARPIDIEALQGLQHLMIEKEFTLAFEDLENEEISYAEVVLSPHSRLGKKTIRELHFREVFGLSILGIWRNGHPRRFNLRDMTIRMGDSLLVFGQRDKLRMLAKNENFIMLSGDLAPPPRTSKAIVAGLSMLGMVLLVALKIMPLALASIAAAVSMVLGGCLTMREAQRSIRWSAIFLIAGMLPLGIALQTSGAAELLATSMLSWIQYSPAGIQLAGLFLVTALVSQVIPNPVTAVIMSPIALTAAINFGYSPQAIMLLIAIASSSSFFTPIGHATNVLIMGPGGYQFKDYLKAGIPFLIFVTVLSVLALPFFWPLVK
jgi:di/tricarboxylate transporter